MAEPKKYLDLEGLKTFWRESKKYIDDVTKGVGDNAVDISSLNFEETAVVNDSGVSITLNKSNISGTQKSPTSVTIPLVGKDSAGIVTNVINGNGTTIEYPENGSIKVDISVDESSIKISETGSLTIDTIDGGTFN